ncbi:hypothetical protein F2Q70_00042872 [Brassica cretica]|uniref:Uncharacterized protein n=1 Tax=Brassica cretica TaxID=69181 RepID=A0A8S9KGQ4_BRACR|nr:hypothetical protein F2Q70_00042872 [Brassica cretica]
MRTASFWKQIRYIERESYAREKRRRGDGEGADLILSYDSDCPWCTFRYNACSSGGEEEDNPGGDDDYSSEDDESYEDDSHKF